MLMFADWMVPGVARRLRERRDRELFSQPIRLHVLDPSIAVRTPAPDGVVRTLRGYSTPVRRRGQLLMQIERWLQTRPGAPVFGAQRLAI